MLHILYIVLLLDKRGKENIDTASILIKKNYVIKYISATNYKPTHTEKNHTHIHTHKHMYKYIYMGENT